MIVFNINEFYFQNILLQLPKMDISNYNIQHVKNTKFKLENVKKLSII
jgi:hypothetical protein